MIGVEIRDLASPSDDGFLRDMLYTALYWNMPRLRIPSFVALRIPQLRMYHAGWGRPGDLGFVALEDGERVGVAWCRRFTEREHGDGFIDEATPELAVAVVRRARGRGVGRRLMTTIHDRAKRVGVARMGLSVDARNPAKRLYASLGYVEHEPGDRKGRMVLDLLQWRSSSGGPPT